MVYLVLIFTHKMFKLLVNTNKNLTNEERPVMEIIAVDVKKHVVSTYIFACDGSHDSPKAAYGVHSH